MVVSQQLTLHTVLIKILKKFDYAGIERNYLLGAIPWGLSRALPVLLALTLGGGAVDAIVKGIGEVQWLADGLTLAGKMLPALGFAILLRYLPVKRNLHYLALGFAVTAMLTTIYTNLTSAGTAIATVVKDFDAAPFKGLPMIVLRLSGAALATIHYKNGQKCWFISREVTAHRGFRKWGNRR